MVYFNLLRMSENCMMTTRHLCFLVRRSRRERACCIALVANNLRLVESYPVFDFAAVLAENQPGVVTEVVDDLRSFPTFVLVLQRLWKIPVIERYKWFDSGFFEHVQKLVIVLDSASFLVISIFALARGTKARPGKREAIIFNSKLFHVRNIALHVFIRFAGIISCVTIFNFSRRLREHVPDIFPFSIYIPSTFDLVRGSCERPLLIGYQIMFSRSQ